MIPYGRQEITQADVDAVVDVLQSDFLTQGPCVPAFEDAFAQVTASRHAVAVNSATSALHIACLALDLGPGDTLWTTPITFVASANCALYCGADVSFVDIDPKTFNLCPNALKAKFESAAANNCLPKVLVAVHLCGQPCDMATIKALCDTYNVAVIEDASHAVGGRYKGAPIGNCQYSQITVFSFHPVKIITTGEGGIATTNSEALAKKMSLLRSHGVTRDPALMTQSPDGPWYYQQVDLGFNYRMTDMQAALGLSQLERLADIVSRRHELAERYTSALQSLPVTPQLQITDSYSGYHLYVIRLQTESLSLSHKAVFEALRDQGIGVNLHYIPVHTQPYYLNRGFKVGDYPNAEAYYQEAISLPLFPTMTPEQQDTVISTLTRILEKKA